MYQNLLSPACFPQIFGSRARVRWRALWLPGKEGQVNTQRGQEVLQTDHLCAGLLPQSLYMVRILDFAVLTSLFIKIHYFEHSKLGTLSLFWFKKVKCVDFVVANIFCLFSYIMYSHQLLSSNVLYCCFLIYFVWSKLKWSIFQSLQSIMNTKYHHIEILLFCTFEKVSSHTLTHTFWVKD